MGCSSTSTREPNNVPCFLRQFLRECHNRFLFSRPLFEARDEGKIQNATVNVSQQLMQAKMRANFSFFSKERGGLRFQMVGATGKDPGFCSSHWSGVRGYGSLGRQVAIAQASLM